MHDDFDDRKIAEIASSLRFGDYNLLLGAGISLDSTNGDRSLLPSTETFRTDLCALKGANPRSSLQRVFSSLNAAELADHVVRRFSRCTAGPSLTKLSTFLWHRIFTFNIDDAVEDAYRTEGALQIPSVYHFDDDYIEISDRSIIPVVHLHGWVGAPKRDFVFSRSEYVRQIKEINPWMVTLTQFLRVDPFVIAGTSLDEVDLEFYLAHRSRLTAREDRGPSILVEPHPDAVTKADCEKYNLILFEGTFADFLDYIDRKVPERPRPIELVPPSARDLFPPDISARKVIGFAADFELVPTTIQASQKNSAFLYGHPPSWNDLAGNLDIGRQLTGGLITSLERALRSPGTKPYVTLLLDDTGSGKTTVVRRTALEIAKRGVRVISCSALSRVDANAIVPMLDLIEGPLLVVVDNFADQANAIGEVLRRLTKRNIAFLCAERSYRMEYVRQALSGTRFVETRGLKLTKTETDQLIAVYRRRGLIGASEVLSNKDRFIDSVVQDPIAIASCRILNDFRPLDRIIESLLQAGDDLSRRRYRVAALAYYCFKGGVRFEVLASICGLDSWNTQLSEVHPLPLSYLDRGGDSFVIPFSGTIANRVLDRTERTELLSLFTELAIGISPRMNRQAIKLRTPEARLAGRLFDYDQVVKGFLRDLAPEFYAKTRETWQWNSRYWEQMALLRLADHYRDRVSEAGKQALRDALQHAKHAVALDNHPFPLTTLGKILLVQMVSRGAPMSDTYGEAFEHLNAAIRMEREWLRNSVQPFITILRGTRSYVAHGGRPSPYQAAILRALCYETANRFEGDREAQEASSDVLSIVDGG